MSPLLAQSLPDLGWLREALRWLAAAGAALIGGFVVGLATQFLVGVLAARKAAPPGVWLARVIGGGICALLVLIFWAGVGGTGGGTGGGQGAGQGTGTGGPVADTGKATGQGKNDTQHTDTSQKQPVSRSDTVQVEILDPAYVGRVTEADPGRYGKTRSERFTHCYRLSDADGRPLDDHLLTLPELVERLGDAKVRKIVVTQYQEGHPEADREVRDLFRELDKLPGKPEVIRGTIQPDGAKDMPPRVG